MSEKSDTDWKQELSPEQYQVCRCGGTEAPFSGAFNDKKDKGTYTCACCGAPLFSSDTKYDSGSGWPAFYDVISHETVSEIRDVSYGMTRTEVRCAKCDSHLGHKFPDGPKPTGLRYCINSASLGFEGS